MKKFMCGAAVICILLCAWAQAGEIADEPLGEWHGKMTGRELLVTLTLSEDGRYDMYLDLLTDFPTAEGDWAMIGENIVMDPDTEYAVVGAYDGRSITIEIEGEETVFTREAPEGFVPAEPRRADTLAEFDGSWAVSYIRSPNLLDGALLPASATNMAMSVQVDGGTVRLDSPLLGEEGWIVECGLEDGSLKGSARNTSGTGAVRWVVLTLLEDGTLQITIQREDGDPHAFYCAR